MTYTFANNAASTLASTCSIVATSLAVQTGHGSRFPSPTGDQRVAITVQNGSAFEIMEVTARAGDILTVERAKDGTIAQTWLAGSSVDIRLPRIVLDSFAQKGSVLALAGGTMVGPVLLDDTTSVSTPPLAFDGDSNTGLGHPAPDTVSLVTSGNERFRATNAGVEALVPIIAPAGDKTAPGVTFSGDGDTGVFRPSANEVGITVGGTYIVKFDSAGQTTMGTQTVEGVFQSKFSSKNVFETSSKGILVTGETHTTSHSTVGGNFGVGGGVSVAASIEAGGYVKATTYLEAGKAGVSGNQAVVYSQFPLTANANGTMTLPNGVVEKWGGGATADGEVDVTFPTPFPTAVWNIHLTVGAGTTKHNGFGTLVVGTISPTGFKVWGKAGESLAFYYRAIGN